MDSAADAGPAAPSTLLALNAGSSSLKFGVYTFETSPHRRIGGSVSEIGKRRATLCIRRAGGATTDIDVAVADHAGALATIWDWLVRHNELGAIAGVGHRLVHGGPTLFEPQRVTPALLAELQRAQALAFLHVPVELELIRAVAARAGGLPQVVCVDTEFHRDLPAVARCLPLPRRLAANGLRRFGFHGLSYSFLLDELARLEPAVAQGRVILAHLGHGASLAAVREGRCIDTSMAFTPAAGVPMSTRSGDLDPGVLTYLARTEGWSAERIERFVNTECGLLGVSETTGDLSQLLARSREDSRAAEAVDLFCYHVRKWIGAFAAALGGLDALVFSGGVGEHLAAIRSRVCEGLEFLGLALDREANVAHARVISSAHSAVRVRVISTNEEQIIARAIVRTLAPAAAVT